jgi:hypothetical protein
LPPESSIFSGEYVTLEASKEATETTALDILFS